MCVFIIDYAYVDSQQPELPYHICVIRDFKMVSSGFVGRANGLKWKSRLVELAFLVDVLSVVY